MAWLGVATTRHHDSGSGKAATAIATRLGSQPSIFTGIGSGIGQSMIPVCKESAFVALTGHRRIRPSVASVSWAGSAPVVGRKVVFLA